MRLGLVILRAAIRGYRRYASGRGPLRAVGCSFAQAESCSAYGLRMAESCPSSVVALRRIRARLRRCRGASVYRMHVAGQPQLLWGPDYDDSLALADALREVEELPATRWAVLDAARQIAAFRGQGELAMQLRRQRDHALASVPAPAPRLLVRRGDRLLASLRARVLVRVSLHAGVAGLVGMWLPHPLAIAALLVVLASAVHALVQTRARQRHFARQLAAASFSSAFAVRLEREAALSDR